MKKKKVKPVKKTKKMEKAKNRKARPARIAKRSVPGGPVRHIHEKAIRRVENKKTKKVKAKKTKAVILTAVSPVSAAPEKNIFPDSYYRKPKIKIIGIGGGAGSIISEIVSRVKWADFAIADTDARALSSASRKLKKIQFGQELTKGLGTGMNPTIGELAAQNEKEKIKKIFEGQDLCVILACLGGGTSSGAVPIFAKISRDCGCLSFGIFTLPFEFEGDKKMEIAWQSLEKIKHCLNVYSVIPNESIFKIIEKNAPLKTALSAINGKLSENIEGLIGMIHSPGLINIDFADLKAVLNGRGRLAYLNMATIGEGGEEEPRENNISEEKNDIDKIISDPLYTYNIKGAKGILYNIVGGKDLRLAEVSRISDMIFKSINKNAKIIFGISQRQENPSRNKAERNKVRVAMLAVGCGPKSAPIEARVSPAQKNILENMASKAISLRKKMSLKKRTVFAKKSSYAKDAADRLPEKPRKRKFAPAGGQEKIITTENRAQPFPEKEKFIQITNGGMVDGKVRRNALQLKKEAEKEQKELIDQEMILETPAILRKK